VVPHAAAKRSSSVTRGVVWPDSQREIWDCWMRNASAHTDGFGPHVAKRADRIRRARSRRNRVSSTPLAKRHRIRMLLQNCLQVDAYMQRMSEPAILITK